jgi:hypothetical protein
MKADAINTTGAWAKIDPLSGVARLSNPAIACATNVETTPASSILFFCRTFVTPNETAVGLRVLHWRR